jgi:2'-5' RNA ligase
MSLEPPDDPSGSTIRLFIALPLPDPIRAELHELAERLRKGFHFAGCVARWLPPESYHLTLAFLGNQPASMVERCQSSIDRTVAAYAPQRMELKKLGVFPHWGRPSVLWTAIRDRSHQLPQLHRDLNDRLTFLGYQPEDREFFPHITLARFKGSRGLKSAEKVVGDHLGFTIGPFVAPEINLYQSILRPEGACYEVLSRHSLTGDPAPKEVRQP